MDGFIGCYSSNESKHNFVRFSFDENHQCFRDKPVYYSIQDAKYLALESNYLYTIAYDNGFGFYRINSNDGTKFGQFIEPSLACYIGCDNRYIYTANYHDGCVHVYDKQSLQLIKRIDMGLNAGCHQVVSYDHYMLVPCLLLDRIFIYDIDGNFALINTIEFESNSGPRHCVIRDKKLYVVTELSNEVIEYEVSDIYDIKYVGIVKLLDKHQQGSSAAIRLSNNGKYLYVSIRDVNVIKVIDTSTLSVIQTVPSGGNHPRDITLSKDNQYLFIVNRLSHNCVVYTVNPNTGLCETIVDRFKVIEGISVVLRD